MGLTPVLAGTDLTAAVVNQLPVVVSPALLASVTNSNAETAIGTYTVPGGTITAANQGFKLTCFGTLAESGGPTCTIRLRVGGIAGTIIYSASNAMANTAALFTYDGWVYFTAVGAGGTVAAYIIGANNMSSAGSVASSIGLTNNVAWNTLTTNTIVATAQYSAASASNTAAATAGSLYQL